LINKDDATVLECSKVDGDVAEEKTPSEATYVQSLLPEELPENLMDSLQWLTASKLLQITGNSNGSSMAQARYENSVKLL